MPITTLEEWVTELEEKVSSIHQKNHIEYLSIPWWQAWIGAIAGSSDFNFNATMACGDKYRRNEPASTEINKQIFQFSN